MEKRQSNQMDGWSIELPYPPTINHAYMTIKSGKRLLKPEFIEFKYMVQFHTHIHDYMLLRQQLIDI
jgi:hypothetical protein